MTDPITTTVTWQDLIDAQTDELDDLRERYEEVAELAREEYGEGALERPDPPDNLQILQQQAAMLDQSARQIQSREHFLKTLRDELGSGPWELKMLSAEEAMDTEVQLRADVQAGELDEGDLQNQRNIQTVNAAVVDAPAGVPRDDAGNPLPSKCPNALVVALYEQVQRFNSAGATDFRAAGFGGPTPTATERPDSSARPSDSEQPSEPSATTDEPTPDSGAGS